MSCWWCVFTSAVDDHGRCSRQCSSERGVLTEAPGTNTGRQHTYRLLLGQARSRVREHGGCQDKSKVTRKKLEMYLLHGKLNYVYRLKKHSIFFFNPPVPAVVLKSRALVYPTTLLCVFRLHCF